MGRRAVLAAVAARSLGSVGVPITQHPAVETERPKPDPAHQVARRPIEGYASAQSVRPGDGIDFHVSAQRTQDVRVEVFRLGWVDGADRRLVHTGPWVPGTRRAAPDPHHETGAIDCRWPVSWTFKVPPAWTSGLYLADFVSASGVRDTTPFVVRDDTRSGGLCVVLPFTTYQAYNQWPRDGRRGKSLYYGYPSGSRKRVPEARAVQVSYNRPYMDGGQPAQLAYDHEFIKWAERSGYELAYATSQDLDAGRVDPARYRGLIFSGHDEYWSHRMRQVLERAIAAGTSVAFLSANNVYWHVRVEDSGRAVTCYKDFYDPYRQEPGSTAQWRHLEAGHLAEQGVLGVQYTGIVAKDVPLVVRSAHHWLWAGTGVHNGAKIPNLVGGEADGVMPDYPQPKDVRATVLSESPYRRRDGDTGIQNTNLYETRQGGLVFVAGTFNWTRALGRSTGYHDSRIERATANLLDRMLGVR